MNVANEALARNFCVFHWGSRRSRRGDHSKHSALEVEGMMVKEVTQEKKARMAKWDARDQKE